MSASDCRLRFLAFVVPLFMMGFVACSTNPRSPAATSGKSCTTSADDLLATNSSAHADLPEPGVYRRHLDGNALVPWLNQDFYLDKILVSDLAKLKDKMTGAQIASLLRAHENESLFSSSYNEFIRRFADYIEGRVVDVRLSWRGTLTINGAEVLRPSGKKFSKDLLMTWLLIDYMGEKLARDPAGPKVIATMREFMWSHAVAPNYQMWLESAAAGKNVNPNDPQSAARLFGEIQAANSWVAIQNEDDDFSDLAKTLIYLAVESSPFKAYQPRPPSFDFVVKVKMKSWFLDWAYKRKIPEYRALDGMLMYWVEVKEVSRFQKPNDVVSIVRSVVAAKALKPSVYQGTEQSAVSRLVDFHGHRSLIVRVPWNRQGVTVWDQGGQRFELDPFGGLKVYSLVRAAWDPQWNTNLFADLAEKIADVPGIEALSEIVITDLTGAQIVTINIPATPVVQFPDGRQFLFQSATRKVKRSF
jgi:hypothetical protein